MTRPFSFYTFLFLLFSLFAFAEWGGLHWLTTLDNRLLDVYARQQTVQLKPDTDIVIIDVDEKSLASMGELAGNWPWPRAIHAELLQGLLAQKPAAVVFDILMAEPDVYRPESDQLFNQAVSGQSNVFFPFVRMNASGDASGLPLRVYGNAIGAVAGPHAQPDARVSMLLPLVLQQQNWRGGLINFLEDADGIGRRYWLYMPAYGWGLPSMPVAVAASLGWQVPQQESLVLHWSGPVKGYRHVSYSDLYLDFGRAQRQRAADEFAGKIIIIGTSASGLHDLRATPVSSLHPGVEILATALDNLKNGRIVRSVPDWVSPVLTVLLLLLVWGVFRRNAGPLRSAAVLLGLSAILLLGSYLAYARLWLWPVATPLLLAWLYYFSAAVYGFVRERLQREKAVQIFNRFLDPRVVKELVDQGQTAEALTGESREITVLFSDIRGFTTLSEQSTPQEIVSLLNRYFTRQVEVIFKHGGTLDKFIGDAIMAFWGAPAEDPQHARHAVEAALEMSDVLDEFKRELGEAGLHFDVGIGIHSGPAVVGFIGSERRQDYTAIGDTVNLSSRIEGETKGRARILVSAATRERCGDSFDFNDFGFYKVKGRAQEVQLLEPRRKT